MDDLISRKWLMECVEEGWIKFDTEKDKNKFIHLVRDTAPSAQPEQQWIPCSERLPEALQEVLVTSTNGYVYTSRIVHGDFEYGGNVIAWMPLPEPYAERRERAVEYAAFSAKVQKEKEDDR